MLKSRHFGDLLERVIRFRQNLLHPFDLDPPDFRLWGSSDIPAKLLLQLAARGRGMPQDLVHMDAVAGPGADVAQSRRDTLVLDGEDVGRWSRHHAKRLDPQVNRADILSANHPIEEFRSAEPGLKRIGLHT